MASLGLMTAFGMGVCVGALALQAGGESAADAPRVGTLRPVEVTLHRFDISPGRDKTASEWIDFLRSRHAEAIATLGRERMYLEAMFSSQDEPRRLYWLTVQGVGGAAVETATSELDRKHVAYMKDVLVKGSHVRLVTRNVLAPDFAVAAVRAQQLRER